MKIKALALAGCGLLLMAGGAQADPYVVDGAACPDLSEFIATTDVTGNEGGASQCFGAFDGNGPGADGIETNGMVFDYIAKSEWNDDTNSQDLFGTDIGLNVYQPGFDAEEMLSCAPDDGVAMTGAASSGCWSYDSSMFSAEAFIILIKAANTPGWAAYLFEGDDAASDYGSWLVAWSNQNDQRQDISHLSIYAKNGVVVSEPGTLALLGLGLIGVGFARRRASKP